MYVLLCGITYVINNDAIIEPVCHVCLNIKSVMINQGRPYQRLAHAILSEYTR